MWHLRELVFWCLYKIQESSRQSYIDIIDSLGSQGAEAIILGCTEIGLLIQQEQVDTPSMTLPGFMQKPP